MDTGGTSVGSASFQIGIDLAQLQKDFDRAEQLAKQRASRIQTTLGSIPVGGGTAGQAPGGVAAQQGQPNWVQNVYTRAIAGGATHAQAAAALRRFGVPPGQIPPQQGGAGAAAGGGGLPPLPPQQPGGGAGGGGGFGGLVPTTAAGWLRVGAGLAGVGLGINVVAGVARQAHRAIADAADESIRLAQAGRSVAVAWGSAAQQFTRGGAAGFVADPSTRGTEQQYLQVAASLETLAAQYGLTRDQVHQLDVASGRLARLHGVELPQASQILQSVLRGQVQAGEQLNIQLVDEYGRLRSVGLSYDELSQAVGRTRAVQVVYRDLLADVARQQANSLRETNDLTAALDRQTKAGDRLKSRLADLAKTPTKIVVDVSTGFTDTGTFLLGGPPPKAGPPQEQPEAQLGRWLADHLQAGPAAGRQGSSLPTREQINRAQDAATAQQLTNETAGQSIPISAEALAGQERADRVREATEAQNKAQIQLRQQQGRVDILQVQSEQRRLGAQQRLNELSGQQIELQDQLAPLLTREATLRDQITLGTMQNLDLEKQKLQAQQAAVAPTKALTDIEFRKRQAELRAVVAATQQASGETPSYSIDEQAEIIKNIELKERPKAELASLEAQHQVDVAGQSQSADQISKAVSVLPQRREAQDIEGQVVPLEGAERLVQAQADAIQRGIQASELARTPALIEAQTALLDSKLREISAALVVSNAQAAVAGLPQVVNNITVAGNVQVDPDLLDRITSAASAGTLDAISKAQASAARRVPSSVAGGH